MVSEEFVGVHMTHKFSSLEKRIMSFLRHWSPRDGKPSGPTLIECDGQYADAQQCYGVLYGKGKVDTQYVRVASKLYNKEWSFKFEGRSSQILLDPSFSLQLISKTDSVDHICEKYGQPLESLKASQLAVIFVPILLHDHWWCAAFSFKDKKVWFIDSMFSKPAFKHQVVVDEVMNAVDALVHFHDKTWVLGDILHWETVVVEMKPQTDNCSCGVRMLCCIKACAERFTTKFSWGGVKISNARMRLLIDDIMSDCCQNFKCSYAATIRLPRGLPL